MTRIKLYFLEKIAQQARGNLLLGLNPVRTVFIGRCIDVGQHEEARVILGVQLNAYYQSRVRSSVKGSSVIVPNRSPEFLRVNSERIRRLIRSSAVSTTPGA